ncbi:MAG TPA: hydrogenase nickel incorporation protein HypB [Candidatus Eremiobacteraeota bacterium]|nr:MAG: Hydrogenase isoenzymes nickel incorporation protein HypB [bacterium ADurb.Bin363]HPZ08080.1 hydrogenase nickel incorporation protein HypB [Candidatus Eremiobacteraeota bacterium]
MNIPVLTDILSANNLIAEQNRKLLDDHRIYMVNLLSSPGAGKTTFIEETIKRLDLAISVIEGDVASDVDAVRIKKLGIPVVQINTGGSCHLNAPMIQKALENLPLHKTDLIFIENVGNLICPAGYKLGENISLVMNSTTEGDDKILKYPGIFRVATSLIINKIDLLPYLDYSLEKINENFLKLNPQARIFPLSSKTGEGFDEWIKWIRTGVDNFCNKL